MKIVFAFLGLTALIFSIYCFGSDFTGSIFIGVLAFGLFIMGVGKAVLF